MQNSYFTGLGGSAYGVLAQYGSLNLTVSSPAQSWTEPLTLAETKAYLNVPPRSPADTFEDSLISAFIAGARNQAEILQGRDLVRKQWDMSLDYFLEYQVRLRAPLVSVDLLQYRTFDGTLITMDPSRYVVDTAKQPGIVVPTYNTVWPAFVAWPSSAVLIRFTCGFSPTDTWWNDDGYRVKTGMKYLISAWFNNRLPFELGSGVVDEYPYSVTALLSYGSLLNVR